ncbi:mRNA cap guanine-N7 methyltransferase [Sorochytrium milnesiophthora]
MATPTTTIAHAQQQEQQPALKRTLSMGSDDGAGEQQHQQQQQPRDKVSIVASDDNALLVRNHYNARKGATVESRKHSDIYSMRSFNNWVKSTLISEFVARGSSVLDMGCGKGGDLQKYARVGVRRLHAIDIADMSVREAEKRYREMSRPGYSATFSVLDCYKQPLGTVVPSSARFDVVSMQFCMHYAFETEAQVRQMLANVTSNLSPGGRFIGTTTNAQAILQRLLAVDGLSFGNSIYNIRFESKDDCPIYGHRLFFTLQDAVEDCPEYLAHWEPFVKLAKEYGLELLEMTPLHEFYARYIKISRHRDAFIRMNRPSDEGHYVSPDEWEAVGVYVAFAFKKVHR